MAKNAITGKPAKLLRQLIQCILNDPSQFNMDAWIERDNKSSCGTTSCIAGWVAYLVNPEKFSTPACSTDELIRTAAEALDIYGRTADELWYVVHWPNEFIRKYELAKTPRQRAEVAAARIEHYIKTGR